MEAKLHIKGGVYEPSSAEYLQVLKKRWNGDVVNNPKLIAQPLDVEDVVACINYAREQAIGFAVVCGAHGSKSVTDGLFVDLSSMKKITVNPESKTCVAEGGCLLGDVDRASAEHGLAAPFGHVSHTGLGLVLGGGIGYLSRSLGLSVDNLLEVEAVTCEGKVLTCNETENSDLFWAICGAGANFAVITKFTFKLSPVKNVLLGTFVYPPPLAAEPLLEIGRLQDSGELPNELSFAISLTPDGAIFMGVYNGPEEKGRPLLEKFGTTGKPVHVSIAPIPYTTLQTMIDEKVPHGGRFYQKGPFLKSSFNKDLVDKILHAWNSHPTKICSILFTHLGGKVTERPATATPYVYRDATYQILFLSVILDPTLKPEILKWTNESIASIAQYSFADYINSTDAINELEKIYGVNYPRIVELKKKYDPTNFFRANINIKI